MSRRIDRYEPFQTVQRVHVAVSISYPTLLSSPLSLQDSIGEPSIHHHTTGGSGHLRGGVWIAPDVPRHHPRPGFTAGVPGIQGAIAQALV